MLNVGQKVSELRRMTVGELRREYAEVFGEQTRSFHKEFLVRRIAWRVQANAEGGLPDRARQRALEIANDADLRMRPPPEVHEALRGLAREPRRRVLPLAGTVLSRVYLDRTHTVTVLERGFLYDGAVYKSLTAAARAITGSDWNGPLFFGLTGRGGQA